MMPEPVCPACGLPVEAGDSASFEPGSMMHVRCWLASNARRVPPALTSDRAQVPAAARAPSPGVVALV